MEDRQARRKSSRYWSHGELIQVHGQIHRKVWKKSFVCGFEGMSDISSEEMILDSSMVEHSAVNRRVVGSSPTRGVKPVSVKVYRFFV